MIGAAVALSLAGLVGTALAPSLLTYHPLWLIVLSPIDRHMVLAATATALLPFVLVSSVRRTFSCSIAYGFGRSYGPEGTALVQAHYPRTAKLSTRLQRIAQRFSPIVILLAPWPLMCGAVAGAAEIAFWPFFTMTILGQVIWARLTYRVGTALSVWLVPALAFVREHVVATTIACVVLVALYAFARRKRQRELLLAEAHCADAPAPSTFTQPETGSEG